MRTDRPAEVFPPGDFLRDELDARAWTQEEFASIIGRPTKVVNEVIVGKKRVTPETAMDFAAALGTSAQFWLNLESAYQLYKATPADERAVRDERIAREARLRELYPVREIVRRGWVEDSESFDVLEARVFEFYGVTSLEQAPSFAHAAKRNDAPELSQSQWAWLFRAKNLATSLRTVRYSAEKLREALTTLETFMEEPDEIRHVPRVLADCGVRFLIVEPLPGSKIDGVCFWIDDGQTPVIALSLRLQRIDNFWFVLRHEIEHVLREDGKDAPIVDEFGEDGSVSSTANDPAEIAANAAASSFCAPTEELDDFIARVDPLYSERKVLGFSKLVRRHPGIVVGQIHNKTKRYELFRKFLVNVRQILIESALTDGYRTSPKIDSVRS